MTTIVGLNILSESVKPIAKMEPRRRRLSSIAARHAPKERPFIVSVHRAKTTALLKPTDDTVRLRRQWKGTLVGPDDIVIITSLPLGGGGQSAGKQIGATVALLALALAAPWAASAVVGSETGLLFNAVRAGIVIGGAFLIGKATTPKANDEQSRTAYGVSGGGNLPRKGDRIPVLFGDAHVTPDLSQPDYFEYDGDDVVLYKRVTLTAGKANPKAIEFGTSIFWTSAGGVQSPYDGSGGANSSGLNSNVEIIHPGGFSQTVPGSVHSSPQVGGLEIPYTGSPSPYAGPFRATAVGKPTTEIQIDVSLPQGVYRTASNGTQAATDYDILFQYAPCNDAGVATGPYVTLLSLGDEIKNTNRIRITKKITVASGHYLVRSTNQAPDQDELINGALWDGLRSHYPEQIARDVTELALRIRSGPTTGQTNFSDMTVRAVRVLPVWNGSSWVEAETRKAVYAFKDILQNEIYGAGLDDSEVDLPAIVARATSISEFDTYDGVIRGPVSVWDAASSVLAVMRAEPVRLGTQWSIQRDEPRDVALHVVTRRQIDRSSTKARYKVGSELGAADVILEYDEAGDGRKRREVRETFGPTTITPRRLTVPGVSGNDHARHLARWMSACAKFRRRRRGGTVWMQGRLFRRGDPIRIDAWFLSKDRVAAGIMSRSGNTLTLDTAVTIVPNTYITLRNRKGREFGPILVTAGALPNSVVLDADDLSAVEDFTLLTLADVLSNDDEPMTSVLIGPIPSDNYIIESVTPQDKYRAQVEAVYDAPEVWDALGEPIAPGVVLPSIGVMDTRGTPVLPWVSARCIQKTTQTVMVWGVGPARGCNEYLVELSYNDGALWETVSHSQATSGEYSIRHEEGVTVRVRAYAIKPDGVRSAAKLTTFTTLKPVISGDTAALIIRIPDFEFPVANELFTTLPQLINAERARLSDLFRIVTGHQQDTYSDLKKQRFELLASAGNTKAAYTQAIAVAANELGEAIAVVQTELDVASGVYPTLGAKITAMDAATVSAAGVATAARDEVVAARNGKANIAAELSDMRLATTNAQGDATATRNEVIAARNGQTSLLAETTAIRGAATTAKGTADAVAGEVVAARDGAGSLSANVTSMKSATAAINGKLNARFQIITDVNSYISGIYNNNSGAGTSTFDILADVFRVSKSTVAGGAPQPMFATLTYAGSDYVTLGSGVKLRADQIVVGVMQSATGKVVFDLDNQRLEMYD